MFHNKAKKSRYFLFIALFGIIIFVATIFIQNIPEHIQRGQQGITAIQLLDAIRSPLLAIEAAELQKAEEASGKTSTKTNFEQRVAAAQRLIRRYQDASRYNAELAKNVDALAVLISGWVDAEQAERKHPVEDKSFASDSRRMIEDRRRLLDALTLLAAGEAPIHSDIEQGRAAEHLLQWSGITLIIYLFLLIIFSLRVRQRETLSAYQAVEQARNELHQRENYLSLTLNSIGDAVIATDKQGYIRRMNPVAETLTGWRQEEAKGHPLPDAFRIVNAHSRQPVDNPVEKVLSSGQIVGLANHTVLIARDGSEYQIADSGAPIMDEQGKILGVILVFRDISEEYRQQEALYKTQRNLAEAQQLAHIGNWELDLANDTLTWSDEIFRIFELDPDEFQPSYAAFLDNIHPDDREQIDQAYMDSLKNKAPYDLTHRLLMKDGRIKYVHEYCKTLFDDDGKPLRSFGLVQDISERRKLEDERSRTASEWKQAMDSIDDAIYLIDLDDRIIRANKTFYQLTGLQPEQVIGQDINHILHPKGEPVPCPVCRARKARKDTQLIMEADHPDNPTGRPIEIMLKIIRNEQEEPVSILMVIHDLTTQREIENKLRQHQDYLEAEIKKRTADLSLINHELESFSYSISHDLRAPLRSINGFAAALSEDYADSFDGTANDYLHRISAAANRMSELIDDLLMLSRINRQELNKSTCNLSHMANEIRQQLAEQYPRDNLQWRIQGQLNTSCDANLIRIALENMFGNALKYSSKKNHAVIEFGCEQKEGKNIFYIRDNGAGFDMQYFDKLFGAFQRLHGKEFEGTGIGLTTVQRIIHRHGGKIWAEAEVNKGATFYFTLD
ncbi:diguanylate cyclase/phosphodiesterase (GGDEF & EAL domains) with PAS/PAC sensor(s) [hydrothermal vent metagenome]|uniref:histidine kinase n=1 Tax=hydrothermal vent metagenome TaxID=652676 RepID=A0A3B1BFU8_9ZZZZ